MGVLTEKSPENLRSTDQRTVRESSVAGAYFERFLAVWQDGKGLTSTRLTIVALCGLVLICGAEALIGAVPTRIYGHDIFIYLSNGWRVLNGQRPHVDFTCPWGPIGFLVSAFGLALSHHSVVGIGYGTAIVGFVVGLWAFFLGKGFLSPVPRLLMSFFLTLLVVSPYPLGLSPFSSSSAMIYNRYAYGLLGLIILESYRVVSLGRKEDLTAGFSTGAVLALELFLKASYFFLGIGLIAILIVLFRHTTLRRIWGMLAGFAAVSFCVLVYLHFAVGAMIRDLRMAAGARLDTMPSARWIVLNHWPVLLGVLIFCGAATFLLGDRAPHWRRMRLYALGVIWFFADVNLIRSNAQVDGFVVCSIFAILILDEITRDQAALPIESARVYRPAYAAVLGLGALLVIPQFVGDVTGLGFGLWEKEKPSSGVGMLRFTSPDLRPLLLYESSNNPPSEGRMFTNYVNDGVALLQREARPDEKVLTMDITNPFPYAMERPTPRGGHAAPTYHYNITDKYRPSDDWYFGDADIVMVPKRASQGDNHYIDFFHAYGPGLKQRFALAAESSMWWMYRRKP